jgi:hypothetical protein
VRRRPAGEDIFNMLLDGALAHDHRLADLAVGIALGNQHRDLALACGQPIKGLLGSASWRWPAELRELRRGGAEESIAG